MERHRAPCPGSRGVKEAVFATPAVCAEPRSEPVLEECVLLLSGRKAPWGLLEVSHMTQHFCTRKAELLHGAIDPKMIAQRLAILQAAPQFGAKGCWPAVLLPGCIGK